jgi:hypothetical protein
MATKKIPVTISGQNIFCVYSYEVSKTDDVDSKQSETGDEILYLYRRDVYTLNMSFKCNAETGRIIDSAISSSVLIPVTFQDLGQTVSRTMRVNSYSYRCITLYGKEFWDISVSLQESCR